MGKVQTLVIRKTENLRSDSRPGHNRFIKMPNRIAICAAIGASFSLDSERKFSSSIDFAIFLDMNP